MLSEVEVSDLHGTWFLVVTQHQLVLCTFVVSLCLKMFWVNLKFVWA